MKSAPIAYSPGAGSVKPSSAAFLAKNLCGICVRMPAPSPARGSAPTAPRCSRLTRMVSASATIWCDLRPLMSAMKPTPHESLSSAGSYIPRAGGTPGSAVAGETDAPLRSRAASLASCRTCCWPRSRPTGVALISDLASRRRLPAAGAPASPAAPLGARCEAELMSCRAAGPPFWRCMRGRSSALRCDRHLAAHPRSPDRRGPPPAGRPAVAMESLWDSNAVLTHHAKILPRKQEFAIPESPFATLLLPQPFPFKQEEDHGPRFCAIPLRCSMARTAPYRYAHGRRSAGQRFADRSMLKRRIFRRNPSPDLIRSGQRFADKDIRRLRVRAVRDRACAKPETLMHFASDNATAIAPAVLDAIVSANHGHALGYGN